MTRYMCRFVESIRLEDGILRSLDCHQKRLDATIASRVDGSARISLSEAVEIPPECRSGLFKCRVVYTSHVHLVEFVPYERNPVRSFALADGSGIDYSFKYEDRSALNSLKAKHPEADEIIIVKDGVLTDSHAANLVFEKDGEFVTPENFLHPGTMRAKLLAENTITARRLTPADIPSFERIHFINAMNALGERVFEIVEESVFR